MLAASHSAISRGVPRTATVPDPNASAVSAMPTTRLASPRSPGSISVRTASIGWSSYAHRVFIVHMSAVASVTPGVEVAGPRSLDDVTDTTIVDPDVVDRVLERALQRGGAFAEIYAEDKRGTGLGLDDGRIEQVTTGRDRGAGIRVVRGDTT